MAFKAPFKPNYSMIPCLGFVGFCVLVDFFILNKTKVSSPHNPSHSIKKEQEYLPCTVSLVVINISGDSRSVFSKQEKNWEARTEKEMVPLKVLLLPLIFMQNFCCSLHLRQNVSLQISNTLSLSSQFRKALAGGGKYL